MRPSPLCTGQRLSSPLVALDSVGSLQYLLDRDRHPPRPTGSTRIVATGGVEVLHRGALTVPPPRPTRRSHRQRHGPIASSLVARPSRRGRSRLRPPASRTCGSDSEPSVALPGGRTPPRPPSPLARPASHRVEIMQMSAMKARPYGEGWRNAYYPHRHSPTPGTGSAAGGRTNCLTSAPMAHLPLPG